MARLLGILLGAGAAGLAVYWVLRPGAAETATTGSPRSMPTQEPPVQDWKDKLRQMAEEARAKAAEAAKAAQQASSAAPRGSYGALVDRWVPEVVKRAGDMPIDPILEWMRIESGGKLCAPGTSTEFGLFQLNFPGDAKYGATLAQLKEICQRSQTHHDDNDLSWMSEHDLDVALGSGLRKIAGARDTVRQVFASSGVHWPEDSFDFWTAVKQVHSLPAVITELLPKIVKRDGHVPASWSDFKDRVLAFPVEQMGDGLKAYANAPSQHKELKLKNRLEDTLRNSSFVGLAFARGAPARLA